MRYKLIILLLLVSTACFSQITGNFVTVRPQPGDDWPQLQRTIDRCIKNKIKTIVFRKGTYDISRPLLIEDSGRFVSLNLIGEDAAHFTGGEDTEARIEARFLEGFAIGYQMARSSLIKGLVIYGAGRGKDTRFDVYAAISIDPFHRPKNGTSGSSGILIRECRIRHFTAGIVISQNGVTLNAENIHVEKVSIDHVKVAYATCQRQSKQNTVRDLICWDNIETVFDGKEYGQGHGVIPYIDGANIASFSVGRIFNFGPQLVATSAQKIFAETIEQIGIIEDGGVGVTIRDSYFDFAFYKFPPYHFKGHRVNFDNVTMRYYDDLNNKRIIIDGIDNVFMNGYADVPFLMKTAWHDEKNRTNYYFNYRCVPASKTRVVAHKEIEEFHWLDRQYIDVENKRVIVKSNAKAGDYLTNAPEFFPYAKVKSVSGDTLYLECITNNLKSGFYLMGINKVR